MKKNQILIFVALTITTLGLTLIPHGFSQPENVKILSYSIYVSPASDYLTIVGEAQNTGPNVIDYVYVTGTFYAPDGTIFMQNYAKSLTTQILPQQKIPFFIVFSQATMPSGTQWTSQDATNFTLTFTAAPTTTTQQYQDLTVVSHSGSTDTNGYYAVTGTIKNTGSEKTNQTWVVATFYNSTGSVIGVGWSKILTPTAITAGSTASFTIPGPEDALTLADYTYYTIAASEITEYVLVIQTKLTEPSATPTPTASPSTSPTPTSPSTSPTPTPTGSGNGTTIPDVYIYAAIAVVAVVIVVGVVALILRKRTRKSTAIPQEPAE